MSLPPIPTSILRRGAIVGARNRADTFAREIARPGAREFGERAGVEYIEEESGIALPGGTESWQTSEWGDQQLTEEDDSRIQWQQVREGMQNGAVQENPNKFLNMLGTIAKPLAYLDVPTQLASEAIFDTLETITPGDDTFDWIQGTDPSRELFQGWKAVGKAMRGESGLIDATNEIVAAFEKKPLWSQIATGFVMGGVATRVSNVRHLGKLAKPLAYSLDPTLGAWHAIKPLTKAGYRAAGLDKASRMRNQYGAAWINDPNPEIRTKNYVNMQKEFKIRGLEGEEADAAYDSDFLVDEFKPYHLQYNALIRLKKLLISGPDGLDKYNSRGDFLPEDIKMSFGGTPEVARLTMARDAALLDLQQLSAGRPGHVEQMTLGDLERFVNSGDIVLEQLDDTGRVRGYVARPTNTNEWIETRMSVANYLETLKTTKAPNSDDSLYDIMLQGGAVRDEKTGRAIAQPFRAVGMTYDVDTLKVTGHQLAHLDADGNYVNAANLAGAAADNTVILTNRLRFYNRHLGAFLDPDTYDGWMANANRIQEMSGGDPKILDWAIGHGDWGDVLPFNMFPNEAQPLRALAATRVAVSPGTTPDDVAGLLGHSEGSGDLYVDYIFDADLIDVMDDMDLLHGRVGTDGKGYFHDEVGVTLNSVRASEKVKGVRTGVFRAMGDSKKVEFADHFDFDLISDTFTRHTSTVTGRPLPSQVVTKEILAEDLDWLSRALAETRARVSASGAKGPKKSMTLKGGPGSSEYDDYTFLLADIRFHRILNTARTENGHEVFAEFFADYIDELKQTRDIKLDGNPTDPRSELLLKVGAFHKAQEEGMQLLRAHQRIDMRKQAIHHQLVESGWLQNYGTKKQPKWGLRMVTDGEGNKIMAPNKEKMARWMERRGIAGQIDFAKAWELWGGVRQGDNVEFSGVEDQFIKVFGEVEGKRLYSAAGEDLSSYQAMHEATRRVVGQPHAHEVMINGLAQKQRQLYSEWVTLQANEATVGVLKSHPVYDTLIHDILADGLNLKDDFGVLQNSYVAGSNSHWIKALATLDPAYSTSMPNINAILNTRLKPFRTMLLASDELAPVDKTPLEKLDFTDTTPGGGYDEAITRMREWLGASRDRPRVIATEIDEETGEILKETLTPEGELLYAQQKLKAHIAAILNSSGVRAGGMNSGDLKKALESSFKVSDVSFGRDLANKSVTHRDVQERLNAIQKILSSEPEILTDAQFSIRTPKDLGLSIEDKDIIKQHQKWLKNRRDIEIDIEGVPIDVLGGRAVRSSQTIGEYIFDVNDYSDLIQNPKGRFSQKLLGLEPDGTPSKERNLFQQFYGKLAASAAGGAAARGISNAGRIFIARRRGHAHANSVERTALRDIKFVIGQGQNNSLGLYTDAPTRAQRDLQGAGAVGNQFFGSVGVKRVQLNKAGDSIIGWADGSVMSEPIHTIFNDALKAIMEGRVGDEWMIPTANDANFARRKGTQVGPLMEGGSFRKSVGGLEDDIEKLMTQVDVMLGYVPIDQWDNIYSMTPKMRKELNYLQNITARMDDMAEARGFNIQSEIDAMALMMDNTDFREKLARDKNISKGLLRKPEYIKNGAGYIPLLRKRHAMDINKHENTPNATLNNFAWWVKARQDDNIFHVLTDATRGGGNVMESLDVRLAKYVGTMHKHVIDLETNKALKAIAKPQKAWADERSSLLRAMSTIVKARRDGRLILQTAELKQWDIVRTGDYEKHFNGTIIGDHMTELMETNRNPLPSARKITNEHAEEILQDIDEALRNVGEFEDLNKAFGDDHWRQKHEAWLDGLSLSKQDVDILREHMGVAKSTLANFGVPGLAKGFQPMARIMRTFKAGFDVGVMLIHGYNALVTTPFYIEKTTKGAQFKLDFSRQAAWGKAAKNMIKMLWNPDYYDEYMAQPDVMALRDSISPFVVMGHSEPLSAIQDSNTFTRWRAMLTAGEIGPVKSETLARVSQAARLSHRMESSFVGALDTLRMNIWESTIDTVKRDYARARQAALQAGEDPTQWGVWTESFHEASKKQRQALADTGATVNKMTGVYDRDMAGLTPTQGVIENSFLFFAPAYRRASYAVIADLFQRNQITPVRNREAARQLTGLVSSALIMASAAEYIFGNEGAADPRSGNFGKFEINGVKMGIGTAYYTISRLAGDAVQMATIKPDGDVQDWLRDHPLITALGRRGRSQLAPPAALAFEIWDGKTYMGDPLRDPDGDHDWDKLLAHGTKAMSLPFWGDSMVQTGNIDGMSRPTASLAELCGLQAWAVSDWDNLQKARKLAFETTEGYERLDTFKRDNPNSSWEDLPALVKAELEDRHIGLNAAMNEYRAKEGQMARGDAKVWHDYHLEKGQIDKSSAMHAATASMQFEKGLISGKDFNDRIRQVKFARFTQMQNLYQNPRYLEILEKAQNSKDKKNSLDTTYFGDMCYEAYTQQVLNNDDFVDDNGVINWDKQRMAEVQFKNEWDLYSHPEIWEYVKQRKNRWWDDAAHGNPMMEELEYAKQVLDPYWNIHSTFSYADQLLARRWLSAVNDRQRAQMVQLDPELKGIDRKLAAARLDYRKRHPAADWFIVKYHNGSPVTEQAAKEEIAWRAKQNYAYQSGDTLTLDFNKFDVSPAGRLFHHDVEATLGNLSL